MDPRRLMRARLFSLFIILTLMMLAGCSWNVPAEEVYGTYVASYPYGTETVTLNRDGTFVQSIAIKQETTVTVQGTWEFESGTGETRVTFHGARVVDSGSDHPKKDWQTAPTGLVSLDISIIWFHVQMATGDAHPYMKQ
jgi:hypothetical protein